MSVEYGGGASEYLSGSAVVDRWRSADHGGFLVLERI